MLLNRFVLSTVHITTLAQYQQGSNIKNGTLKLQFNIIIIEKRGDSFNIYKQGHKTNNEHTSCSKYPFKNICVQAFICPNMDTTKRD